MIDLLFQFRSDSFLSDECTDVLLPPPGMVLVRTETGQLVMVPQQVLAQAQAKTQQGQAVANITQRPATPTAGATIRVTTTATTVGPVHIRRRGSVGCTVLQHLQLIF